MRRRDKGFSKRDGLETKKWFKEKKTFGFQREKDFWWGETDGFQG